MERKLTSVGSSVGVTLPPTALEMMAVKRGDTCDVYPDMQHFIKTGEKRFVIVFKAEQEAVNLD